MRDAPTGAKTTASSPSRRAAQAVAAPWLPVEAVTTPRGSAGSEILERGECPPPFEGPELEHVFSFQEQPAFGGNGLRSKLQGGLEGQHAAKIGTMAPGRADGSIGRKREQDVIRPSASRPVFQSSRS